MFRVLIASADEMFAQKLQKHLQADYFVETCGSGKWALELVNTFSPDIIILDNKITERDCLSVIQATRLSGKMIRFIVVSNFLSPYVEGRLASLDVDVVVTKPCKLTTIAGHLQNLCQMIEYGECSDWSLEQVLDDLMMMLGFSVGSDKYRQVKEAILLRYHDPGMLMKEVYLEIVSKYGAKGKSVEKAFRDAIRVAWNNGDRTIWNLLFYHRPDKDHPWPSNDEFICRIVLFLQQRERIKPQYKDFPAKIV